MEYANKELAHLFAASDIVISRAGANVINELAALRKPSLLIPLGTNASRGDQLLNADSFLHRGFSDVLKEEAMNKQTLVAKVFELYDKRDKYIAAMSAANQTDPAAKITEVIISVLK